MIKKILNPLLVIIGTLIGAGFASGQEIYLFFYKYGINGILGIFISSILLGIILYKVLKICNIKNIDSYKDFLGLFIKKEKHLDIINLIMNIFILITFFIMISGFGAYFEQQFGINSLVGSTILATICYFVFLNHVSGLIKVNQYLVPILIFSFIIIGLNILKVEDIFRIPNSLINNSSSKWILDSILYSSYNTILLIPVLITLKNHIDNKKSNIILTILVVISIITLSLILFFILTKIETNIENIEMPIVYIVSKISKVFQYIYGFIILNSIFTTSVSLGTSFLENVVKSNTNYKKIALFICVISVIVSKFGFSNLVNLLYPIFGYIGFIQIIKIIK